MADTEDTGAGNFRKWVARRLALVPVDSVPMDVAKAQGRSEETSHGLLRMNDAARLGDEYLAAKRYEEAKRQYEIAWQETGLQGIQTKIGEVSLFLGDLRKALASFIGEIERHPYHFQACRYLDIAGWLLSELPGDVDDETARAILVSGFASFAYQRNRMLDEAIESFEKAVELAPQLGSFHRILGDLYDHDGSFQAALREHSRCYELNPSDVEVHHLFGIAVRAKEELNKLTREYESAGLLGYAYQLEFVAQCLEKSGRTEEAEQYYGAAVESGPTVKLWVAYAGTLRRLGRHSEAIAAYRKAAQIGPLTEETRMAYAHLLTRTGALREAISVYLAVEQGNPHSFACQIGLGRTMVEVGNADAGIEHLERAVKLAPRNSEALRLLGQACERQGQIWRAIEYYQRLVEAQPYEQRNRKLLDEARRRLKG
jgi:tetratricopeptide (TPR) repeat protein